MVFAHGPWRAYLERYEALGAAAGVAVLTEARLSAAERIDRLVDRQCWIAESGDHWDHRLPGDCENFALKKRVILVGLRTRFFSSDFGVTGAAVWSLGALRVCVGNLKRHRWSRAESHAVLCLMTDRGDLALNIPPFRSGVGPIDQMLFKPVYRTASGSELEVFITARRRAA